MNRAVLDLTKEVQTREGHKVTMTHRFVNNNGENRILALVELEPDRQTVFVNYEDGAYYEGYMHPWDLVNKTVKKWVNIYFNNEQGRCTAGACTSDSKEEAQENIAAGPLLTYLTTIEVDIPCNKE